MFTYLLTLASLMRVGMQFPSLRHLVDDQVYLSNIVRGTDNA